MPQLLLFMAFLIVSPVLAKSYSLADLKALASEGSFAEFFEHALDIKPSERDEEWKGMVSTMAHGLTRQVRSRSSIRAEDFQKVESLYEWPSLRTDEIFKLRRQEIGLRYLEQCLKSESPCWKELSAFWEADKTDPDTAFKLAELSAKFSHPTLTPWTFLELALKSPLSEFYCKKELTMKHLWHKLELDYVRLGPKGDFLRKIDSTVHADCLPSLNKTALERVLRPEKTGDRELAFKILDAQGKADNKIKDLFYTIYLLERPSQGELFNYSWNRLNKLGSASQRRERVLEMLKKLDPLPDEILSSLDLAKKRAVLNHFKSNFPEYIDFYAKQCVNYYSGQGEFPTGNPTIHCPQFMSSELAPKLLDESQIKKFQEARKI